MCCRGQHGIPLIPATASLLIQAGPGSPCQPLPSQQVTSKQLHDQCLDLSDQLLQSIVQQALKHKQRKIFTWYQQRPRPWDVDSCCSSLAWLLGALSKRWGIMRLAARLDLQQALLAAGRDSCACYILIAAGTRMSQDLIRLCPGPVNEGPRAWVYHYLELGLSSDVDDIFISVLTGKASYVEEDLPDAELDSQLLFDLTAVALKTDALDVEEIFLRPPELLPLRLGWSPNEVLDLALLAAKRLEVSATFPLQGRYNCNPYGDIRPLASLLSLPAARGISGRGYADLLLVLLKCLWGSLLQKVIEVVMPQVEWDQQLIEQIAVTLSTLPPSLEEVQHSGKCTACSFLASGSSSAAVGQLPYQLLTGLFEAFAAPRIHGEAAALLIHYRLLPINYHSCRGAICCSSCPEAMAGDMAQPLRRLF